MKTAVNYSSHILGVAAVFILCQGAWAQEFCASFFQVYFSDGEGPANQKYIYTDSSAMIDLVGKGKARIVCLGEIAFTETQTKIGVGRAIVIPDPSKTAPRELRWGIDMKINYIKGIPPKGPLPIPRWEIGYELTANLFSMEVKYLLMGLDKMAVLENDVPNMVMVSGSKVTDISRGHPIEYMLPIGGRSIVYVRIEPVEK